MNVMRIQKLRDNARMPVYGSAEAAGADLHACLEADVVIRPGETAFIPTGIAMEVPKNCAGLIYARSGMGIKRGLAPANKVGVVDSDYRGEVMVALHNHGSVDQVISHGERIAQLLITPVLAPTFAWAKSLDDTERGQGGFGSTGK